MDVRPSAPPDLRRVVEVARRRLRKGCVDRGVLALVGTSAPRHDEECQDGKQYRSSHEADYLHRRRLVYAGLTMPEIAGKVADGFADAVREHEEQWLSPLAV